MLSCWIKSSLSSVLRNPVETEPGVFGALAQVLSFDEEKSVMVLHDSEYLVSAILCDDAKRRIFEAKVDPSKSSPMDSSCSSRFNIQKQT